jgi:hypothetical protein
MNFFYNIIKICVYNYILQLTEATLLGITGSYDSVHGGVMQIA